MLILFNVGDTVGRKLGGLYHIPVKIIIFLAIARASLFITTYMIAYYAINKDPSDLGGLNSDAYIVINMILFALTNGYTSTQCAIKAP